MPKEFGSTKRTVIAPSVVSRLQFPSEIRETERTHGAHVFQFCMSAKNATTEVGAARIDM